MLTPDKQISLRRAAGLIHKTQSPSPEQVERVQGWIASGELQGDAHGTTADAIADFLARRSRQREARAAHRGAEASESAAQLDQVYHQSLKTFFLAVIFQRRASRTSVAFQRAVIATQVSLLVLIGLLVLFSVRIAFAPLDPQRAAVVAWLQEHQPDYRDLKWHKPIVNDEGNTLLRVEFSYATPLGKHVHTVRTFVFAGNQLMGLDAGD